ncbi:Dimerisation domain-containing protein [Nocardioides alpinus]|uniref:Dimerisation domain-containing protein n=1 Tax=Nocardioides alpinus TaxID=748909 RepID=A0A1I0ZBM8_9ACTN|nr:methyltransferase [Nocardioides alpinus]PKH40703.1 methyltransferase [Nocardioides alpinus]SFB23044.1 Dimerisation domain-containing protein [Nocardioides alpinus]
MTRLPPVRVVRAATSVRTALQSLTRRMVPPEVGILELTSGCFATHTVHAVARLGIADALAPGARSPREVADELGTSPDATHRLLRAAAALGLFREDGAGRFALTSLGATLRTDTDGSMRAVVLMIGDPRYQAVWGQLTQSVTSGRPGAEAALGVPMWDYVEQDREFAGIFNDAMTRLSALDWPAVAAAYDFTSFATIVDLGGGHGQLLTRMLKVAPDATGVLFEQASVMEEAEEHVRRAGVLGRCRLEAGSFFDTVPDDGDLYVLRRVVHDFDDDRAVAILSTVCRQMPDTATLLLMESIVPSGDEPHFAKSLDLDMLVFVGGRERTEDEYDALLDRAGFRTTRVVPTISTISLIEARAVV